MSTSRTASTTQVIPFQPEFVKWWGKKEEKKEEKKRGKKRENKRRK
jgi:hypothetical protein